MKKITELAFRGRDKKSGLLKECVTKAINEHKNVQKGLGAGLTLLVARNTGTSSFYFNGKRLGEVSHMTLADAFKRVEELKEKQKREKQKQELEEKLTDQTPTLEDYFKKWIDEKSQSFKQGSGRKSNIMALFNNTLLPLHKCKLSEFTPYLVYNKISAMQQTQGNKYNAVQVLVQCLQNAANKGIIPLNPLANFLSGSESPFKKPKAEGWKWVKADELKEKFLEPLKNTALMNRVFYLFIVFTGFRFNECRLMSWDWIDLNKHVISIPENAIGANKTQRPLVKPISKQLLSLLEFWKPYCNGSLLFQSPNKTTAISEAILREPWKSLTSKECDFHGIRKSMKTWLVSEGKQNEFISELALTHDVRSSIQKTYDKYTYLDELRNAFTLWNNYIETQLPKEFKELIKKA